MILHETKVALSRELEGIPNRNSPTTQAQEEWDEKSDPVSLRLMKEKVELLWLDGNAQISASLL